MIWVLYVLIGTGIGVCVCVSVWDSSVCVCLQNVIPSISITVAAFFLGHTCGLCTSLGQRLNPHHRCGNAASFSHCATGEPPHFAQCFCLVSPSSMFTSFSSCQIGSQSICLLFVESSSVRQVVLR